MRFVLLFLVFALSSSIAIATPGDKYGSETKWSDRPASKRQARTNDAPTAPLGFSITKKAANLGDIIALATIDNDVFVADAAQDRILRLKSRNADSAFETRAEFLIGFSKIQDLATDSEQLFMADSNGIWRIAAGNTLVATKAPTLLYRNSTTQKNARISIAKHPDNNDLIVGHGSCVFSVNIESGNKRDIICGDWRVEDIAVSPSGGVWVSVTDNGVSYILPIRSDTGSAVRLKLPPNAVARDIQFWRKSVFPKNWPAEWMSDLIFSLDGNHPMIARAHFNFGDIGTGFTAFIDGFSNPSRLVGGRDYWGIPSAFEILDNGQIIFGEKEQGTLWALEKNNVPLEKFQPESKKIKPVEAEPEKKLKPLPPVLPRGSSINSASNLETDELLKKQGTAEPEKTDD